MTHDRSTTETCFPSMAWLSVVLRKIKFEHRSGANFLLLMFQRAMEVCFFTASVLRNPYLDFFMTQERGKMKKILIIIIKMTKSGTIIILSCTFWQGEIMFRPDINALRTHVVVSRCDLVFLVYSRDWSRPSRRAALLHDCCLVVRVDRKCLSECPALVSRLFR